MKRKEFFSNDSIYNEVNKENTYFFKYKNSEGYYITEYIRNMDSNTVICVFAKTFNGPLNDSLLTMELLAKRISK